MKVRYIGAHDAVEFAIESGNTVTIATCARGETVDVPEAMGLQLVAQGWEPGDNDAAQLVELAHALNDVGDAFDAAAAAVPPDSPVDGAEPPDAGDGTDVPD